MPRFPLIELDEAIRSHLAARGGRPLNLHRALGSHPRLQRAWIDFASALRHQCSLPRGLRELLILRVAQRLGSAYQWSQHLDQAIEAGIANEAIRTLAGYAESGFFGPRERTALALTDAVTSCRVDDAAY